MCSISNHVKFSSNECTRKLSEVTFHPTSSVGMKNIALKFTSCRAIHFSISPAIADTGSYLVCHLELTLCDSLRENYENIVVTKFEDSWKLANKTPYTLSCMIIFLQKLIESLFRVIRVPSSLKVKTLCIGTEIQIIQF